MRKSNVPSVVGRGIGRCRVLSPLQFLGQASVIERKTLRINARLQRDQLLGRIICKVDEPIAARWTFVGVIHNYPLFVRENASLSGLTYVNRLKSWKRAGYRIDIVYLKLSSARLALRRVAARVRQGGHNVPRADVVRRFLRGWENFQRIYRPLADSWTVYDNSGGPPRLLEKGR